MLGWRQLGSPVPPGSPAIRRPYRETFPTQRLELGECVEKCAGGLDREVVG